MIENTVMKELMPGSLNENTIQYQSRKMYICKWFCQVLVSYFLVHCNSLIEKFRIQDVHIFLEKNKDLQCTLEVAKSEKRMG